MRVHFIMGEYVFFRFVPQNIFPLKIVMEIILWNNQVSAWFLSDVVSIYLHWMLYDGSVYIREISQHYMFEFSRANIICKDLYGEWCHTELYSIVKHIFLVRCHYFFTLPNKTLKFNHILLYNKYLCKPRGISKFIRFVFATAWNLFHCVHNMRTAKRVDGMYFTIEINIYI